MLYLYKILYKSNIIVLSSIGIILPVLIGLTVTILDLHFPGILSNDDYDPMSLIKETPALLFSIILIGPLLETIIQYIPVSISNTYFSKYKYANFIAIIISSLIFALLHRSGLLYFITLFFAGFLWASICFVLIRRRRHPYINVAIIHAFYNIIILSLDYLFFEG